MRYTLKLCCHSKSRTHLPWIVTSAYFWFLYLQLAEKMLMEHTRKLVEEHISNALSILKSKTRAVYDMSDLT